MTNEQLKNIKNEKQFNGRQLKMLVSIFLYFF
jgi:hypothetical protein